MPKNRKRSFIVEIEEEFGDQTPAVHWRQWMSPDSEPRSYDNTAKAVAGVNRVGVAGKYRVIAVCDEFELESKTVTKTKITRAEVPQA